MRDCEFYSQGERDYVARVAELAGVALGVPPALDALPAHTRAAMPDAVVPEGCCDGA
jgi:hypothetical protein